MIRRRSHPDASVSTHRLEAYTDGVFAIAATLLVLDLTSRGFEGVRTNAELTSALLGMAGPLLTFAVSFVILSLMWATHVSQFEHIVRVDGLGTWINNIRLLFIVLVPFTSTVLTEFSDLLVGRMLLPINFFFAILCGWLQWAWAARHRDEMMPDLSADDARLLGAGSLSAVILAAGVVALSALVGSWAFFLFFLDGPLTRLLGRRRSPVAPDPA